MYTGAGKRVSQKRMLIMTAVFLITAIIIGSSISGFARVRRQEKNSCKYYSSIMIEKGDTLWSIASENMTSEYGRVEDYIEEIRSLNHLYSDGIYAGEYLTIPRYFKYTGYDD